MELTLMTIQEVAELLQVGTSTIRDYVYTGELECIKMSERKYMFMSKHVASFLEARTCSGTPNEQKQILETKSRKGRK